MKRTMSQVKLNHESVIAGMILSLALFGCGDVSVDVGDVADGLLDDPSIVQDAGIRDGSSNTLLIGEQPNGGNVTPAADLSPAGGDGLSSPERQDDVQQQVPDIDFKPLLDNRLFEFGSAIGNSNRDSFSTAVTTLELCAFGRFGMKELTSFTSSVGDFSSEELSNGTWRVTQIQGVDVIELTIESSTDSNAPAQKVFAVELDPQSGELRINRNSLITNEDSTADCEASQP